MLFWPQKNAAEASCTKNRHHNVCKVHEFITTTFAYKYFQTEKLTAKEKINAQLLIHGKAEAFCSESSKSHSLAVGEFNANDWRRGGNFELERREKVRERLFLNLFSSLTANFLCVSQCAVNVSARCQLARCAVQQ